MTDHPPRLRHLTAAELLDDETVDPPIGSGWGPWKLNPTTTPSTGAPHGYSYWIDLDRCDNPAEVLDWIAQIARRRGPTTPPSPASSAPSTTSSTCKRTFVPRATQERSPGPRSAAQVRAVKVVENPRNGTTSRGGIDMTDGTGVEVEVLPSQGRRALAWWRTAT